VAKVTSPEATRSCPECGADVRVSLDDLAKKRTRRCANGHEFIPTEQAARTARKVQKSVDDLTKNLRRFGKWSRG